MGLGKGIDLSSAELAVIRLHQKKSLALKCIPMENLESGESGICVGLWDASARASHLGLLLPELFQFQMGILGPAYGQALC